jgi:hypothetical protein
MSAKFEDRQLKCLNFLNKFIQVSGVTFVLKNTLDYGFCSIYVMYHANSFECPKELFCIDVIFPDSQVGQITVIKKNKKYDLSKRCNKVSLNNKYTKNLVLYINRHFKKYAKPSLNGFIFDDHKLIVNWCKEQFKIKKIQFVICTKVNDLDDFSIIPIGKIDRFFDIKGRFRIKQSGSDNITFKNIDFMVKEAKTHLKYEGINVLSVETISSDKGIKCFFLLDKALPLSKLSEIRYFGDAGYLGVDPDGDDKKCYIRTRNIKVNPHPSLMVEIKYLLNLNGINGIELLEKCIQEKTLTL